MAPAAVDDGEMAGKPPPDVTMPPPAIRSVIEKSAGFVLRRGPEYEDRMKEMGAKETKMQFVFPDNVYHAYYLWRKKEISEGRGDPNEEGAVAAAMKKTRKGPTEPPAFEFSARMPTISAIDLEIVKLTALFVAVRGSGWMTRFSQSYGQVPQFQFLRPQHSFHQYFTRMIDQYRELLTTGEKDLAERQKRRMEELEQNIEDKYHILDKAKQRAEWVKYQDTQKVQKQEAAEADKVAWAQIDWHDFAVVATIEFTEADERANLPEPQSLNDLQSQSLEQKAALGAPVGMRLEEAMPEDFAFFGATPGQAQPQPPQQPHAHTPQPPHFSPMPFAPTPPQATPSPAPYIPAQAASAEEAARIAERQSEADRAAAARAAAAGSGPMRIRENYVPRAQARRANANTVLCPICKQQIAADEYAEHVRIEQLDPRWREQTRIAQQRSSTTNLSTVDVANNLKRLASQRSDVFDPVTGREIAPDARESKRVETQYGGQPLMPPPGAVGAPEQRPTDVQEQLRLLQSKYGGPGQQHR
ncbi:hypothetical protein K461DRAFT_281149 [Myriangium duriaei CBS 260.36]|uniref:SURP motif domain-containing protein n=1 Tax=Myriangium duriaei CBS 260.36 TaxID=1168546 RepID=A0A9P4IY03_9PEZI|nr:hypothetical protein K461DRAFT_281149 [Myriangium duriaei CBS 260.36]